MQTKPTKTKLYSLIALLVVFAGMLSYMVSSGAFLQGLFGGGSFSPGDRVIDIGGFEADGLATGEAEADYVATLAERVANNAGDAAAALIKAEDAFAAYEADGLASNADALASAQEDAETAASNAESILETIQEYVDTIENTPYAIAQAALDSASTAATEASADLTSAEALLTATTRGNDWTDLYEADDAYEACKDENPGTYMINCSSEKTTLSSLYKDACEDYWGSAACLVSTTVFDSTYDDAKAAHEDYLAAVAASGEALSDLVSATANLSEEQGYYEAALASQAEAVTDAAAARSSADEAAEYTILACESLTLDPSSYEMAADDTEAAFDLTVTPSLGDSDETAMRVVRPVAKNLQAFVLTELQTEVRIGSTKEAWQGTLNFETSGDGFFTHDGTKSNPLDVEATDDDDSVTVSFSGGIADDTVTVSVEGEETLCNSSFTITQASGGSVERDPDSLSALSTDTDGDGLIDRRELLIGTDPENADTDGDGTSDGDEVDAGTDPLVDESAEADTTDTDGDGLTDEEEATLGTDPSLSDTDGDGYDDGEEVTEGTDPVDSTSYPTEEVVDDDTDDDGLTDEEEATYGTDPSVSDTDSDGLSDYEEVKTYATDPLDSDSDDDGYEDGTEVSEGTDPEDSSDYPVTTTVTTGEVPTLTRDIILSTAYTCSDSFLDTKGQWHEDIICRAKYAGWVKGYSTTVFGPDGDITRAEYTKVLTKIFGMDEEDATGGSTGFLDVHTGDWYYPYVVIAEDADVIRTRDAGYYFNPNIPITRGDAILWAIRAAGQSTYSYDIEPIFSDVENEDYFAYAVWIANSTEVDTATDLDQPIVEGYTDGTFGPYKNIARSEAMAIATRVAIAWGVASEDWDE